MTARWRPPQRVIAIDPRGGGDATDAVADLLRRTRTAAPDAVLVRPSPRTAALLAALPHTPAIAVLPDMAQLLRDTAAGGPIGPVVRRLNTAGVRGWWRFGITVAGHVRTLAAQDFRGMVPTLIELERAALGRRALAGVAVAAPLTDLLLAAGYGECFADVVAFIQRRIGTHAGFETLNIGHLLRRLAEWRVTPDFVIGPVNARGFRMKPSPAAALAAVRDSSVPVLATEVSARGTVALTDAIAYAREVGAAGTVLPLAEVATTDHS